MNTPTHDTPAAPQAPGSARAGPTMQASLGERAARRSRAKLGWTGLCPGRAHNYWMVSAFSFSTRTQRKGGSESHVTNVSGGTGLPNRKPCMRLHP